MTGTTSEQWIALVDRLHQFPTLGEIHDAVIDDLVPLSGQGYDAIGGRSADAPTQVEAAAEAGIGSRALPRAAVDLELARDHLVDALDCVLGALDLAPTNEATAWTTLCSLALQTTDHVAAVDRRTLRGAVRDLGDCVVALEVAWQRVGTTRHADGYVAAKVAATLCDHCTPHGQSRRRCEGNLCGWCADYRRRVGELPPGEVLAAPTTTARDRAIKRHADRLGVTLEVGRDGRVRVRR